MKDSRMTLLMTAAAALMAIATPALAQDASGQGYPSHGASKAMGKAVAKYKHVQVSEDAVAEVPTSNCHVEHWEADYISHPLAYHTECGPR